MAIREGNPLSTVILNPYVVSGANAASWLFAQEILAESLETGKWRSRLTHRGRCLAQKRAQHDSAFLQLVQPHQS